MKRILGFLAAFAVSFAVHAQELGMVLDVQGNVTATTSGKSAKVEMLSYLRPNMELDLAAGAALTVTWYANSKEMKFSGPAKLRVGADGISGGRANERALAEASVGKKGQPSRLAQATIMMRSMGKSGSAEDLSPPKGARLATLTPRLGWKGGDDRKYRVVVVDAKGATMHEAVVSGNAADVPAQKIAWGESYKWRASFEPGAVTAEGDFSTIDKADADRLAKIRPGANATFSDWVVYAMALEDLNVVSEARPIWRKLSAERPDEPKLKQLSER